MGREGSPGRLALILVISVLSAVWARGQDIRPLTTDSPNTTPPGTMEFQFGEDYIHHFRSIRNGAYGVLWQDAHLGFAWGVSDRVELRVDGAAYKRFQRDSGGTNAGVGDFTVWGKFVVWQGAEPETAFGFRLGVKLPNTPSYKDFGTNQTDFFAQLLAGKRWGRFRLWGNAGVGILDNPYIRQSQDDVYTLGLAFAAKASERFDVVGEGTALLSNGKPQLYGNNYAFRLGLLFHPSPKWAVDVAAAKSSGRLYGQWSATLGLTYRFGKGRGAARG
jgi:hypothetical protein